MAGLVPAIHALLTATKKDVDARDKPAHDVRTWVPVIAARRLTGHDTEPLSSKLCYHGAMKPLHLFCLAAILTPTPTHAFDLQGHRGTRGHRPENTLPAFKEALAIGVTTLELDVGLTADNVLVIHHDPTLNPDTTRDPEGRFLEAKGPALRSMRFDEVQKYDVGRLKPGTNYAGTFREQQAVDGTRIPALTELFALVRDAKADHVRFNIETKLTPQAPDETADPETFASALAAAIRAAGLTERATVQSFDWRTLAVLRRIAPEIARVCLTVESPRFDTIERGKPGPSPWTAGLDIDGHGGSVPRLVAAAGCATWSPAFRNLSPETLKEAKGLGLKVIPWTVNDKADMERLIDLSVDGLITDYPDRARAVLAAREKPLPPQVRVR
jgi:glycerophosphoryl diester phosphodiesterase